jgi:hypothetical protein
LFAAKKQQTASDGEQKDSTDDREGKIASHVLSPRLRAQKLIGPDFVSTHLSKRGEIAARP